MHLLIKVCPDDAIFRSINRLRFGWKSHASCRKSHEECNHFCRLSTRCVSVFQSSSIGWNKFVREYYSTIVCKCWLTGRGCNRMPLIRSNNQPIEDLIERLLDCCIIYSRISWTKLLITKILQFFQGISSQYVIRIIFKLTFPKDLVFYSYFFV